MLLKLARLGKMVIGGIDRKHARQRTFKLTLSYSVATDNLGIAK